MATYLYNLPSCNPETFSEMVNATKRQHGKIARTLGFGRCFLPTEEDTTPDPSQVITADNTNLLLRYLSKQHEQHLKGVKRGLQAHEEFVQDYLRTNDQLSQSYPSDSIDILQKRTKVDEL